MTPTFTAHLKGITPAEAETAIKQQVASALATVAKPYQVGLAPNETDGALTDPLTVAVRNFTGTWAAYTMAYMNWMNTNSNRNDLGSLFDVSPLFTGLVQPDRVLASLDVDANQPDAGTGILTFSVLDPFDSATVTIHLPGMVAARSQERLKQLRRELQPLDGKLWSATGISSTLSPFYSNLMLMPTIMVLPLSGSIDIVEGARLAGVEFTAGVADRDIDSILWNVLTFDEFRIAMRTRNAWVGGRAVAFDTLGHAAGDQPYVVQYLLQEEQLLVSQQGYQFTLQPSTKVNTGDTTSQFFDLRVDKASDASSSSANAAKPKANAEIIDAKGLSRENGQPPKSETVGQGVTDSDQSTAKDKTRRIGLTATYRPGQAISVAPLFQISRLSFPLENGTLSAQGGGPNGNRWSGNYFADFLGFERVHQRVSLRLNGSQELNLQRFLNGKKMDEVQTGGLGNVEWEPFRDWSGNLLRFHFEANRSTVQLSTNTATISKQNLTTAEVGALYYFRSQESDHPQQTSFAPKVVMGLGASMSETTFAHFTLIGQHHRALQVWEYNLAGRFEQATSSTPIFEQPSFGGADVVRGFRADDAIGRRLWSLQTELLHPIPGLDSSAITNDMLRSLVRGLRIAALYDAGGIFDTTASQQGLRSGAGAGLHVDMGLAVLKLDWAYGFGNAATSGSRGKFYFGITLNVPN
jgi:hypothetical protein